MNRGHKTVGDTEVVVKNLSERSETVRRARSVRNELCTLDILVGVYTANEHRGVVLRRSRHHDILSTSVDVTLSLVLREEETRRFDDILSADFVPLKICRVLLCGDTDGLTVNDEVTVLNFYRTIEATVHGVILEHVRHVLSVEEVIDTYDLDVATLLRSTEYETADTSEAVDTYFNHLSYLYVIKLIDFVWLPRIIHEGLFLRHDKFTEIYP